VDRVGEGELCSQEPFAGGAEPVQGSAVIDVLQVARVRILRYLARRGVVRLLPDALEIDDELAERDPVLAQLAAAAVSGLPVPSGPRASHTYTCPTRLRRARRQLWGTHEAARPAPRPRQHRAIPPPPGSGEPLGLADARPPPYFRSITRVKPTFEIGDKAKMVTGPYTIDRLTNTVDKHRPSVGPCSVPLP
jgi:hypothetical protein